MLLNMEIHIFLIIFSKSPTFSLFSDIFTPDFSGAASHNYNYNTRGRSAKESMGGKIQSIFAKKKTDKQSGAGCEVGCGSTAFT